MNQELQKYETELERCHKLINLSVNNSNEAEKKVACRVEFEQIRHKETLDLYNEEYWQSISFSCLNCGTCTYVCPTCWCFDIQDETAHKKGRRFKNWDSCMFPNFTIYTSGHNPRGTKLHRVRQRFMHKLKYHQSKYDQGIMCVGCGRCIDAEAGGVDLREVLKKLSEESKNKGKAKVGK